MNIIVPIHLKHFEAKFALPLWRQLCVKYGVFIPTFSYVALFFHHSGVKQGRLDEGLSPRHCALSLVGEPIMYPEINTLIDELHQRRISTFLVTNAQFPDRIKMLKPITQVICR